MAIQDSIVLGNKIREARKALKISQIDLAERVGIKQPSLSDIEKGVTTNPRISTLRLLAYELNSDFGEEHLAQYLKSRNHNPAKVLVQNVAQFIGSDEWSLQSFVVRLARENPYFRSYLIPEKYAEIKRLVGERLRSAEVLFSPDSSQEDFNEVLQFLDLDEIDLGNVDEFDLEKEIELYDNPTHAINEWLKHDGMPIPEVLAFDFSGWKNLDTASKVKQLKAARGIMERQMERKKNAPKPTENTE